METTQIGDNKYYLSRMPVNGNANIYWEHTNKYKVSKRYGILLYNPSNETVEVIINKKSGEYSVDDADQGTALRPWNDYFDNIVKADLTSISQTNNTLYIAPKASEWLYLDDIRGSSVSYGVVFNGIINLSVQEEKQLMCYAFIFSTDVKNQYNNTPQRQIEIDFNTYNYYGDSGGYTTYERASIPFNWLSGSTDAPVLESGTIDLSERENYSLLFTGYDAPYMNKGEAAGLYYEGSPVKDSHYGENCVNYAVIYKLNISGFTGTKMILEMNPYTNPHYFADDYPGLYVVAFVKGASQRKIELIGYFNGVEKETSLDEIPSECQIYLLISGMSALPVTVRFE